MESIEEITQIIANNTQIIIPVTISLVGMIIFLYQLSNLLEASKSVNWNKTEGEIIFSTIQISEIENNGVYTKTFKAEISYKYWINDIVFIGEKIYWGDNIYRTSISKPSQLVTKYSKGKKVSVYYNPDNFKHAILEVGVTNTQRISLIISIAIIILGLCFINNPIFRLIQ